MKTIIFSITFFSIVLCANLVLAQSSSLYSTPTTRSEARMQLTLRETSFTAAEVLPRKAFKEQDLVFVIVKEQFRSDNTADTERKRKMKSDYAITSWISFDGLNIVPSAMAEGSPGVGGDIDSQFKNKGKIIQKELLEFKIACRIESVCDNGVLYIKGTNTKRVGDDECVSSCSGYIREEDIQSDNSILSERITDANIVVRPAGNVYDSYRRNWGQKLIDRWSPF